MYSRMLVLLDGSTMSEVVFTYARELAGRLCLDLDLFHACTEEEADQLPMRQAYIDHVMEQLQADSSAIHDRTCPDDGRTLTVSSKVVVGYPAEEIVKYSQDNDIDLIMLATHGRSGIRRWGIGSVADKVIHAATVPVWLVPSHLHEAILDDTMPNQRLLVPLDGSRIAESVLPHIITLAEQRGVNTEVMLINVIPPSSDSVVNPEKIFEREDFSSFKTRGEVYLMEIEERLEKAGIKASSEQLVGDAAEEIVRYAAETGPRLIVMSTHGRSGFSRFVFGSVAETVLRRLQKTPVLLVRPQE